MRARLALFHTVNYRLLRQAGDKNFPVSNESDYPTYEYGYLLRLIWIDECLHCTMELISGRQRQVSCYNMGLS
jgi:hypothetical protein